MFASRTDIVELTVGGTTDNAHLTVMCRKFQMFRYFYRRFIIRYPKLPGRR
jgi:hypothetical protein